MRISQFKYVSAIQKYQSISRAADALFVTQPALSRSVALLEKELGVSLFERTNKGAVLTPIGEKLLPHFTTILQEISAIESLCDEEKTHDITANLRISASAIMCNNFLPEAMSKYHENYPCVKSDISENYNAEIIDAIYNNQADIGFLCVSQNQNQNVLNLVKEYRLYSQLLLETSVVALFSSSSPLAQLDVVSADDLLSIPLVLDKKTKSFLQLSQELEKNIVFCQDRDARTKMILQNQGYSIVSTLEVYNDFYIQKGLMTAVPLITDPTNNTTELWQLWLIHNHHLKFYEKDLIYILFTLLSNAQA